MHAQTSELRAHLCITMAALLAIVLLNGCFSSGSDAPAAAANAMPAAPRTAPAHADAASAASAVLPAGALDASAAPVYFRVPPRAPQLLPFPVRQARVQAVSGLAANDPALALLRTSRTSLGGHDFANGVRTDDTWSALRLSQWVSAMQPVCRSPQMQQRYPALPENLDALIAAAYGRAVTAQDRADIEASLAGLALTPAQRRESICLAVLSSLEFAAH